MLPPGCLNKAAICLNALHSARDLWFGRLSISTKVVAVGLVGEAPELIYEIWTIIRRIIDKWKFHITFPEGHAPDWVKGVAFAGWILIVGGVVGEWYTADKANEADVSIQELNDNRLAETTVEAGIARDSAKEAKAELGEVSEEFDALKLGMEDASRQLGKLGLGIRARTPRGELLTKVVPELTKQLAPFAGQRVEMFVCGQRETMRQEILDTWGAIAGMLEDKDAKWIVGHGGFRYFDGCGAAQGLGQGLMVYVSKRASRATMEAAKVLGEGLAKALPPSPNKMPHAVDPEFTLLTVQRG
jgi:hypothetical protein